MKIEFKNGRVVIGGCETTIPEDYWREREEGIKIRRKALKMAKKIFADPELTRKLKDLLGESNSF